MLKLFSNKCYPTGHPEIDAYINAIQATHCPFLARSNTSRDSRYTLLKSGLQEKNCEFWLFEFAMEACEDLTRKSRQGSRNFFILTSPGSNESVDQCVELVHWILKVLFTRRGLVFGKFKRNIQEDSRNGLPIEVAPLTLLSLRNSIPMKDIVFFTKARFLIDYQFHQVESLLENIGTSYWNGNIETRRSLFERARFISLEILQKFS